MVMKFATASEGDPERLAGMARAQVICGEACRSLIARSQLLNKRWDKWSYAEILDLVQRAEADDVPPGQQPETV